MTVATIFGLQRSGTNFSEQLVKRNLVGVNTVVQWNKPNGIWKHAYNIDNGGVKSGAKPNSAGNRRDPQKYELIGKTIKAWYIHKNPYSWIESICTKQVDIKKHYPWVMQNQCKEEYREEFLELKQLNVAALAELYRDHTEFWHRVCNEKNIFHLSYEDLIRSPESTQLGLKAYAQFYGLELRSNIIQIPEKVGQSEKFDERQREKYKKVKLKILTWEQVMKINSILNHEHTLWQGYEIIGTQESFNNRKV